MTVAELIARLQTYDPNLKVAAYHDEGPWEIGLAQVSMGLLPGWDGGDEVVVIG